MSRASRLFWMCVRVLVGVAIVLFGTMTLFQEQLIFHPSPTDADHQYAFAMPVEEKFFESSGHKIHSLLFQAPDPKGLILFFHGNAGSLQDWGHVGAEIAKNTGWSIWFVDYPGFGKSDGKISSEVELHSLARDFFALARKEFPDARVVIYGRSVGTGLATPLAADNSDIVGLILESPFLSLETMAKLVYPWAPMYFLKYKFRSQDYLPLVKVPVLIIHGDQDNIIPVAQGEELAKLNTLASFVKVPGAHHNDLDAFDLYWKN